MKPLLTAAFLTLCIAVSAADRPNVVFVLTDDQGYGDLKCTGNPVIKTPNLDRLASESTVLDDYHVAPTCSPTRSALLTGHWTNRTGVWHTINGRSMLRANEVTVGQMFKDAGYETGMFGKWHLGDNYPYRAEDRGFTEVFRHGGGGVGQTPDVWNNSYFDGGYFHNGKIVPATGFCTDVFFAKGNQFIQRCVVADKPFFAYIALNAPHGPLHAPQEYLDMYRDRVDPIAAFFGMITNIDDNVGKTRQLLEDLGVANNTIFVFSTDNGTAKGDKVFNAGMRGKKGSEYDGGHRVPFFLHWPAAGLDRKHVVETLSHAVDIVPTLLDLCDVPKPASVKFDGVSIKTLLDADSEMDWADRFLVTDSQRVRDPIKWRKSAVMSQRWRLVNGEELYDIQQDPGQQNDVAANHPEQIAQMRAFYATWWSELEPTFSQTTEIYLGHPDHSAATLTAHDWIQETHPPWNQGQIRRSSFNTGRRGANAKNARHMGHWAVKVVNAGTYTIELRRWPAEADAPITASLPAEPNVPGATKAFRANAGLAIPATRATLRIDGEDLETKPVNSSDTHVTFTAELTEGSHQLSPIFQADDAEVGAFYTIVTRIK
jgi:arylsulfatase B